MIDRSDLQSILSTIATRWPSAGERIAADPQAVPLWWKTLRHHDLPDLVAVLDRIAAGDLPRPFDGDFLATVNRESNRAAAARRRAASPPASRPLESLERDAQEAAHNRETWDRLEADHGAAIDSLPLEDLQAWALAEIGPYACRLLARDRRSPLVRPLLLELAAGRIPAGAEFPNVQQQISEGDR